MRPTLVISEEVKGEVVTAAEYYQDRQDGLGEALHKEWVKAVERIMLAPRVTR